VFLDVGLLMTGVPMLADFVIRLAFGLSITSLLISWRDVPLPFFRTQCQVILGLLVLGALDQARSGSQTPALWLVVTGAILAYVSAVSWGLGLPKIGTTTLAMIAVIVAGWLIAASFSTRSGLWTFNASSRITSGWLLGVTLTAMLLGHHYLTAPAMSIEPLKRVVLMIGSALAARCLLAGIGLGVSQAGLFGSGTGPIADNLGFFLAARWGMGFAGTAISAYLTWKTAQIRSTQSATGILYITMIFVLFGELTSLILAVDSGLLC
jgi:hypothetical protein